MADNLPEIQTAGAAGGDLTPPATPDVLGGAAPFNIPWLVWHLFTRGRASTLGVLVCAMLGYFLQTVLAASAFAPPVANVSEPAPLRSEAAWVGIDPKAKGQTHVIWLTARLAPLISRAGCPIVVQHDVLGGSARQSVETNATVVSPEGASADILVGPEFGKLLGLRSGQMVRMTVIFPPCT